MCTRKGLNASCVHFIDQLNLPFKTACGRQLSSPCRRHEADSLVFLLLSWSLQSRRSEWVSFYVISTFPVSVPLERDESWSVLSLQHFQTPSPSHFHLVPYIWLHLALTGHPEL